MRSRSAAAVLSKQRSAVAGIRHSLFTCGLEHGPLLAPLSVPGVCVTTLQSRPAPTPPHIVTSTPLNLTYAAAVDRSVSFCVQRPIAYSAHYRTGCRAVRGGCHQQGLNVAVLWDGG